MRFSRPHTSHHQTIIERGSCSAYFPLSDLSMATSSISTADSIDNEPGLANPLGGLLKLENADFKQNTAVLKNAQRPSSSSASVTQSSRPSSSYRRKPVSDLIQKIVLERAAELEKLAGEALKKDNYEKAIMYLSKAVVLDPENAEIYIKKGKAYLNFCDFQSAILNYRRACILQPECETYFESLAFVYFLQGQTFFDEQKYEDALEFFSKAVELKPHSLGYHTRSIACLAALSRHGECLALVNKRLEIEQDNADLYVMRARLHYIFRNDSLCYFDVIDALKLDAEHEIAKELLEKIQLRSQTFKQQAMRYDLLGKPNDSIAKMSAAIDIDPSVPEFNIYRSALHRRGGDFNAAVDDLLLAMDKTKHDESHPVYKEAQKQLLLTYNDFAVDCFKKGFYEEAIILLNKAIKSEKQEKKLYLNRGDCFYKTRELQFCLSDYLQALEIDDSDESVNVRLATVYNDLGIREYQLRKYQQAEEFFSVAISYNPKVSMFYASRAKARYMLEKSEDAQVDVLSALHLNNNNKEVISLFTRLFPGNATSEALNSEFGEVVGAALTSVISNIDQNETDSSKARPFSPKQVLPCIKPSDVSNKGESLASCMDEKEFAINIIQGKRKVNDLVESVMHARQSLEYNGPQLEADRNPFINTMPSWVKKKSDKNDNKVANSSSSPKTRAPNVPFSKIKSTENTNTNANTNTNTSVTTKKPTPLQFLTA